MGFKNPATSVSGVDTGDSLAGPGVRLYQDTSGEYPRGVMEMRSGAAYTVPASMALTAYLREQDGLLLESGNQLLVQGCESNGSEPASVELNIEGLAGGGYGSVMRLNAAQIKPSAPLDGPDVPWRPVQGGPAFVAWDNGPNLPRVHLDAAGNVSVSGIVKLPPGANFGPGVVTRAFTLPNAGYAPPAVVHRPVLALTAGGGFLAVAWLYINGGSLDAQLVNTTGQALGGGIGFTLGITYPTEPIT